MKVAIVGATGYGGIELVRLLHQHRHVTGISVFSSTQAGEPLKSMYPHLQEFYEENLDNIEASKIANEYDVVFLSAPAGAAAQLVPNLMEGTASIVDLSGDFRIKDPVIYEDWYGQKAAAQKITDEAVYGLSEWNKEAISSAKLIANPGCYPTAVLLGLAPLIKNNQVNIKNVIIDAKSGTSGAGKNPNARTHFSEMNESFKIYNVNKHKHTPEIEQILTEWDGNAGAVTFTPHLVPMTRGIMATMYVESNSETSNEELLEIYKKMYKDEPFVRIREDGFPATKEVYGSNCCDIHLDYDPRTNRITIVSVIDNLVKGAAGQAVQNANIMQGYSQTEGLDFIPLYP